MKKLLMIFVTALFVSGILAPVAAYANTDQEQACWGQATKLFAKMEESDEWEGMGKHASQEETPRVGLRNLAVALADLGVISEPTLQALGAFVIAEFNVSIEACQ